MINQQNSDAAAADMLIIDAESSLSTPSVQQFLFENQVYPFVLPTTLHELLNPCDNSFHSLFKLRYFRLISNMNSGRIRIKEKLNLAKQCYEDIADATVSDMFVKCGLVGTEDKYIVVSRLMCEGMKHINNSNLHKRCLLSFLKWCRFNNLSSELCRFDIDLSSSI